MLIGVLVGFKLVSSYLVHRSETMLTSVSGTAQQKTESVIAMTEIDDAKLLVEPAVLKIEPQSLAAVESDEIGPDLSNSVYAVDAYVQRHGVTSEEARWRLHREVDLSLAIDKIVEMEGEKIAGWGIDHEPEYKGWISLVHGSLLSEVSQTILDSNVDIDVSADAQYSLVQLEHARQRYQPGQDSGAVVNNLPSELQESIAYTHIDMKLNALVIVLRKDALGWRSSEDLYNEAQSYLPSLVNVPVVVELEAS